MTVDRIVNPEATTTPVTSMSLVLNFEIFQVHEAPKWTKKLPDAINILKHDFGDFKTCKVLILLWVSGNAEC